MLIRSVARVVLCTVIALTIVSVGCKHSVAVTPAAAPPSLPPSPPEPTVTLQAAPANVQRGESANLQWSSTNATSLALAPGLGKVSAEGNTTVTPDDSTTYMITAMGPGGSATATARVTVTLPPPPVPAPSAPSIDELFSKNVMDAYFDFDKSDIGPGGRTALTETANFLRSYPQVTVIIEGHCDERGSTEYNLALGDRRTQAAKNFLVSLGVPSEHIETVSYGKERPFCTEHTEDCWQQNRRAHLLMGS